MYPHRHRHQLRVNGSSPLHSLKGKPIIFCPPLFVKRFFPASAGTPGIRRGRMTAAVPAERRPGGYAAAAGRPGGPAASAPPVRRAPAARRRRMLYTAPRFPAAPSHTVPVRWAGRYTGSRTTVRADLAGSLPDEIRTGFRPQPSADFLGPASARLSAIAGMLFLPRVEKADGIRERRFSATLRRSRCRHANIVRGHRGRFGRGRPMRKCPTVSENPAYPGVFRPAPGHNHNAAGHNLLGRMPAAERWWRPYRPWAPRVIREYHTGGRKAKPRI